MWNIKVSKCVCVCVYEEDWERESVWGGNDVLKLLNAMVCVLFTRHAVALPSVQGATSAPEVIEVSSDTRFNCYLLWVPDKTHTARAHSTDVC